MPELPEVETVCAGLNRLLGASAEINAITIARHDLRLPVPVDLDQLLNGAVINRIERRAKLLLWRTNRGVLLNHLGMTGSWRVDSTARQHDHLTITLADGRQLRYHDPRRFGFIDHCREDALDHHPALARLGPEPLDPSAFTTDYLANRCAGRRAAIKALIMDGAVVVGVGNIYAAEACYRAGIDPRRSAGRIARARLERLITAIRAVLNEAIAAGGSTIR
ncbi:MAG: bifunctional DNA-formamidopyrimidine glycosylase/DNA-(apurinic or apyrimidinic site) lyase, partial [Planctomycetota bacterium]